MSGQSGHKILSIGFVALFASLSIGAASAQMCGSAQKGQPSCATTMMCGAVETLLLTTQWPTSLPSDILSGPHIAPVDAR